MTEERLMTIKNSGDTAVVDRWDNVQYTFTPGETTTLRYGVGLHFREKYPQLTELSESHGVAPDILFSTVTIMNPDGAVLDIMWDGHPFHFEPGASAKVEASLAEALMHQARAQGKRLVIAGSSEPEDEKREVAAPVKPIETAEEKKLAKERKSKKTASTEPKE